MEEKIIAFLCGIAEDPEAFRLSVVILLTLIWVTILVKR